jgi:hypothetical protein
MSQEKGYAAWERKVLILLACVLSVSLVAMFGAKVLALLGFGAVGSYTYKARLRVSQAKSNAAKADKAVERMRLVSKSVKDSREDLDDLRKSMADVASKVDWDRNTSAPPPDSLDG